MGLPYATASQVERIAKEVVKESKEHDVTPIDEDITSKITFKFELDGNHVFLIINAPIGKAIHHLLFDDGGDWCFLDLVSEENSTLNLLVYKTSINYYNFIDYEVDENKNEIRIPYDDSQYWDDYKDQEAHFDILGVSWLNYKGLLTMTGGK